MVREIRICFIRKLSDIFNGEQTWACEIKNGTVQCATVPFLHIFSYNNVSCLCSSMKIFQFKSFNLDTDKIE